MRAVIVDKTEVIKVFDGPDASERAAIFIGTLPEYEHDRSRHGSLAKDLVQIGRV